MVFSGFWHGIPKLCTRDFLSSSRRSTKPFVALATLPIVKRAGHASKEEEERLRARGGARRQNPRSLLSPFCAVRSFPPTDAEATMIVNTDPELC